MLLHNQLLSDFDLFSVKPLAFVCWLLLDKFFLVFSLCLSSNPEFAVLRRIVIEAKKAAQEIKDINLW